MDPDETQPECRDFWSARCATVTKEFLLFALFAGFILQTSLVYSDRHDTRPLDARAVEGRRLWSKNGCQSCHQLYGFGGFIGPDLTNVAPRLQPGQLEELLTNGVKQMPAFHMADHEIESIRAFLTAMNETGTGQARRPSLGRTVVTVDLEGDAPPRTPAEALARAVEAQDDAAVVEGHDLFLGRNCTTCHTFFRPSSVGAPDLSRSGSTLTADELSTVLANGRPPLMPKPILNAAERNAVRAFILFMARERTDVIQRVVPDEDVPSWWAELPWWEYE